MSMELRTRIRSISRAFTILEVLIAILILALGLLGLGAVFPVVITQQRNATSTIEGESVASMAEAILRSSSDTVDFSAWFNPASSFGKESESDSFFTNEWIVIPFDPYGPNPPVNLDHPGFLGGFTGSEDGYWFVDINPVPNISDSNQLNRFLSLADRLYPQPFSGSEPKYVWDIVARRQPGTDLPQLGLFVRLIDQRIRVDQGFTLSEVLVLGGGTDDPVLPVAIDNSNGLPAVDSGSTADSNLVYAAPQTLQVQVVQDHLDWLIIEDAGNPFINTSIAFATQPGQKLLDNTGTVRTVIGTVKDPDARINDTRVIRVDPPFQFSHAPTNLENDGYDATANDPNPGTDAERASWVRQIVFTPRTPLAVRVITLQEVSP